MTGTREARAAGTTRFKDPADLAHEGVRYTKMLSLLNTQLHPRRFFEIGTRAGQSMRQFPDADTVCVDPRFVIEKGADVLQQRKRALFFQTTSDEFFSEHDPTALLGAPFDIAFLDGMHYFEYLLRDFINTEKHAHPRSLIVMHDCLPTHPVMTRRSGAEGERLTELAGSEATDEEGKPLGWLGDCYRMAFALKQWRPDLRIHYFDCPPSGLMVVSRLDPASRVLADSYYDIVDEVGTIELSPDRLAELWSLYPIVDSEHIAANHTNVSLLYPAFR